MRYSTENVVRVTIRWKPKRGADGALLPGDPGQEWFTFVLSELHARRRVTVRGGGSAPGEIVQYVYASAMPRVRAWLRKHGREAKRIRE